MQEPKSAVLEAVEAVELGAEATEFAVEVVELAAEVAEFASAATLLATGGAAVVALAATAPEPAATITPWSLTSATAAKLVLMPKTALNATTHLVSREKEVRMCANALTVCLSSCLSSFSICSGLCSRAGSLSSGIGCTGVDQCIAHKLRDDVDVVGGRVWIGLCDT